MKKQLLLLTTALAMVGGMQSQSVAQFADVEPGLEGSSPSNKVLFNGLMYFTATTTNEGNELWKSNGTVAGTVLADDMVPGTGTLNPSYLTAYNGYIYFTGNDFGAFGSEVWRSNGLSGGAAVFADICTGPTNSFPDNYFIYNNELYFVAFSPGTGREIWKTDGVTTSLLKDINPGGGGCNMYGFHIVNGKLVFAATDGVSGSELWVSDGTTAGTQMVMDIFPGNTDGTYLSQPAVLGNQIFFSADDGVNGAELWVSDGTAPGTMMVKDINPGSAASSCGSFLAANNRVYFAASTPAAGSEVWTSDGTAGGTNLLVEVVAGATGGNPSSFLYNNFDGKLYFSANTAVAGQEPWISNGTQAGTSMLKNISPGNNNSFCQKFFAFDNKVFFIAVPTNSPTESELFYSNGTTAGTTYWDIYPGTTGSQPTDFLLYNGKYYFTAADSNGGFPMNDYELWVLNPNSVPVISGLSDQTVCAGTSPNDTLGPLNFTVTDDAPIGQTTVTVSSSNLPFATPVLGGSGNNRTLKVHLNPAMSGTVTIFVTATDANSGVTVDSIHITVNPLPNVSAGADVNMCNGSAVQLFATGALSYTWLPTTLLSCPTCATPVTTATTSITYTVTGTDGNGCVKTDAVNVTVTSIQTPQICLVTVDPTSTNNIIVWDKTAFTAVDSFYVYRDTANNNFAWIGTVPFDSLSEFVDTVRSLYNANGDPNVSSWRYKLSMIDTCGNMSAKSPYHQSMFFQNSSGNFSWNHYQIEGQSLPVPALSNYSFKRDDISNGTFNTIQTLSASSTAFTDPNYSTYPNGSWRVETNWSISCNPTRSIINTSRSNIKSLAVTTGLAQQTSSVQFNIYPNPASNEINIRTSAKAGETIAELYDVAGRLIMKEKLMNELTTLSVSNLAKGVYEIVLRGGTVPQHRKIIIE